MRKLTPTLWFDTQAEEAATFYVSVFKNSKIINILRFGKLASEAAGGVEGSVLTVDFELDGNPFVALNGGPHFKFNEAVSFVIYVESQVELDYYWNSLIADGGEESMCGWLKDKFGLSWQVVPTQMDVMLRDPDEAKSERVMKAMLEMRKLDIAVLEAAYR